MKYKYYYFLFNFRNWITKNINDIERKNQEYQYHSNWIKAVWLPEQTKNIWHKLPHSESYKYQAYPVQQCGDWYWSLNQLIRTGFHQ